jgi:GxxExxY protein
MENKYVKKQYRHSNLTGQLISFAYHIYDELGYGLPERVYQKSFQALLVKNNLEYAKEKYGKIIFDDVLVGRYFIDFLVEKKVAVEFKVRSEIYQKDISQLFNYLKVENIKTGLIIAFSKEGIKLKRLAN